MIVVASARSDLVRTSALLSAGSTRETTCQLGFRIAQPSPIPSGEPQRRSVVVDQRPEPVAIGGVIGPHLASRAAADHQPFPQRAAEVAQVQQPDPLFRPPGGLVVVLPIGVL